MVNRFIGEVEALEFGEGFTIRLDMDGQGRLETEFGDFDFAHKVQIGLAVMSAKYLRAFLAVSLRKDGELVKEVPEIPAPLEPIARHALDAFTLFRYGKDAETWAAENDNAAAKTQKRATANPTKGTRA